MAELWKDIMNEAQSSRHTTLPRFQLPTGPPSLDAQAQQAPALHWQRMQQHPAASIPSSKLTKGARRHAAAMLGDDSGTGAAEGWRTGGRAKRRRHRDGTGGDASPGIQLGVQLGHLLLLTSFLLFVPILWAVFYPPRDAYD